VAFSRVGISDGDTIAVGQSMWVRVIATLRPLHELPERLRRLPPSPDRERLARLMR